MRTLDEMMAEWFTPEQIEEIHNWARKMAAIYRVSYDRRHIMARKIRRMAGL